MSNKYLGLSAFDLLLMLWFPCSWHMAPHCFGDVASGLGQNVVADNTELGLKDPGRELTKKWFTNNLLD